MANKLQLERSFVINSADTYLIGDVGPHGGSWTIHLTPALFDGTIVLKARARGSSQAFLEIPYVKKMLNGSVGDDTSVSDDITGAGGSIIQIPIADGLDVALDCTARDAGLMYVTALPIS